MLDKRTVNGGSTLETVSNMLDCWHDLYEAPTHIWFPRWFAGKVKECPDTLKLLALWDIIPLTNPHLEYAVLAYCPPFENICTDFTTYPTKHNMLYPMSCIFIEIEKC